MQSDAFYLITDGLIAGVIADVNLFILGNYFVVVLALAVADVFVGKNLACKVIVVYNLDHYATKDQRYAHPLENLEVVTIPEYVNEHCETFTSDNDQR